MRRIRRQGRSCTTVQRDAQANIDKSPRNPPRLYFNALTNTNYQTPTIIYFTKCKYNFVFCHKNMNSAPKYTYRETQ